ncbi:hypothetical protein BH23ACT6_BH23ACT6_28020 [soil metagenome]
MLARALDTDLRSLVRPYGSATSSAAAVAVLIGVCRTGLMQFQLSPFAVLAAEVVVGAVTLGVMFRFGPLKAFRADIARRLSDAGSVSGRNAMSRALVWLVGDPLR